MASRSRQKANGSAIGLKTVDKPLAPQATLQTDASVAGDRCGVGVPGGFNASTITCFTSVPVGNEAFLSFVAPSHAFGRLAGQLRGAEVLDSTKNVLGFYYADGPEGMDVAVATVKTGAPLDASRHRAFTYSGRCRPAVIGDRVKVFGGSPRKIRFGEVVATAITLPMYFASGTRIIQNLFRIQSDDGSALCAPGDAGALIVSDRDELLGLLSGSDQEGAALAHQLTDVQTALGLGDFLPATIAS